ncbi:MAG: hypothetical protein P1U56_10560 [Saprospiraceae bacterium]|nr:hypothetical protein [Saprospiraceae bacterium]
MKHRYEFICLLIIFLVAIGACKNAPSIDFEKEKQAILKLHHLQREVHFNKDSIQFADLLSENYISVNRGNISHPTHAELVSRYHNYFSSVEFVSWDDVSEPIIRLSDDAKLAYTIVDKLVIVSYESDKNEILRDTTNYAWTSIYKKYPNGWKIDAVTSTEKAK